MGYIAAILLLMLLSFALFAAWGAGVVGSLDKPVKSIPPTKAQTRKAQSECTPEGRAINTIVWLGTGNPELNDAGYHGE